MLSLDNITKERMLEFGADEELADMGIKLYNYLHEKEVELKNDC